MRGKIRMYLVELRQSLGYSMRKTAREAGISFQHYSKIENGERGQHVSLLIMYKISKALHCSIETIAEKEIEYSNGLISERSSHCTEQW